MDTYHPLHVTLFTGYFLFPVKIPTPPKNSHMHLRKYTTNFAYFAEHV